MHLVYNGLFLLAAIRWGDWKNWSKYHSTILFLWYGDLLYNVLCRDYKMWEYNESIFAGSLLSNHTIITLLIMFVAYPATVLIYLGKFPQKFYKIVLWIVLWVILFSFVEFINLRYLHLISHHNGWSIQWSIVFNLILFPMLYFHYRYPLLALLISFPIVLLLLVYFHVPIK
jgi:hypothetical protein